MPFAVYVLGLSIFAQGTSEIMLSGLLTELSADLGVSIPQAGLLISAFAFGMLIGAPALAVLTLRWPRRSALLVFLAVFVVTQVVAALTPGYWVLFAMRVVGAFVYAGFWAVAATTALSLAPDNARGKAMSIVAGGLTVANIVGLPAGTVIGQHFGWRAAFWAVGLLSAIMLIGIAAKIPGGRPAQVPDLRREVRTMTNPRLWLSYSTTAISTGAQLAIFAYLGTLLARSTGLADAWIPLVLTIYGLGALIGITIGGRTADRHPLGTLTVGVSALIAIAIALALTATIPAAVVPLVFLLGAFGFATNPALNTRVFTLAGAAPTLATAVNFSAFNVGIVIGPWLGGLTITHGLGYPSVAWLGATLGILALATIGWAYLLERRDTPSPATECQEPIPAR